MSGFLTFWDKYRDEDACIQALAELRWPGGFTCKKCHSTKKYRLSARSRIFECGVCGHQQSVTAGTIFHRTRTPLRKWFMAAYLMDHDRRGVSALFISRELGVRYETAWLMCHKLRQALSESTANFSDGHSAGVGTPVAGKISKKIKAWLSGTHHGVSTKHLPRYVWEWRYRANGHEGLNLEDLLIRLAVAKPTITHAELVKKTKARRAKEAHK